ncbi:MAG: aldo/keto reductase [Proteobacteria bacterium]|nr:aldo/keto reductase [Pseudomonadota bacterium]
MQTRSLGRSGLQVAPLAFGGNVFGWTADEARSFALLDAFVGDGFNLIDTADVYSRWAPGHHGGESESVIGRWLAARPGMRQRVVIATKVGMDMGGDHKGLRPAWIRQAVDDSLRRLQTDRIDLYQAHTDDADTPLAETLGAFAELIRAGKVRAIGASNYGAARLQQALQTSAELGLPRYETLQPLYNLVDRAAYEAELQPLCVREGLGVINYFGLARGFLSGKYRSEADLAKSPRGPGVKELAFNDRGWRVLAALDAAAERLNAPLAAVALAWQMRQPGIVAPIASATSLAQWRELAAAATLQLPDDVAEALTQASA